MAENPLYSRLRKRGVVVTVQPPRQRPGKSDEEGQPEKRRRVEGERGSKEQGGELEDDEMWDDFTQEDMEKIDILESQAVSHLPPQPASSTEQPEASTSGTGSFIRPQQVVKRQSRSSSSSNGASSGSYPSQPSHASGGSSSLERSLVSLSSHSSGEGSSLARRVSGDQGWSGPQSGQLGVEGLRKGLETTTEELDQVKNLLCGRDGEVKMLREQIAQKERELSKLRGEKLQQLEHQTREKGERERLLQAENERLKTRLEFKDRELSEIEHVVKQQAERGGKSPEKKSPSPAKGGELSPRHVRVTRGVTWRGFGPGGDGAEMPSSVPTAASVSRSEEVAAVSRKKRETRSVPPDTDTDDRSSTQATAATKSTQCSLKPVACRKFRVSAVYSGGQLPSSHLVSQLMDQQRGKEGEVVDRGIIGLLQMSTANVDLRTIPLSRDGSLRVSPVKSQSSRSLEQLMLQHPSSSGKQALSKNYLQAIQGLQKLLVEDEVFHLAPPAPGPPPSTPPGTVYLLPLLGDYLARYVSLLSSLATKEVSTSTPPSLTASKSGSSESTVESMAASIELLLREGATQANLLETSVLAALSVLRRLTEVCQAVVRLVLGNTLQVTPRPLAELKTSSSSSSAMETDQAQESGVEGDDEASSPSVESSASASLLSRVSEMNILQQLFHIANPTEEVSKCNLKCVEGALDVLVSLADRAPPELLDRMTSLAARGVLTNCLNCRVNSIVSKTVHLMTTLGSCPSVPWSLCTASGTCPLLLMYSIGVVDPEPEEEEDMELLYGQICDFAWAVVSHQPQGYALLLDADCHCTAELVPCLVTVLHRKLHWQQVSGEALVACLGVDATGKLTLASRVLLLLQALSHNDAHFIEHHVPVQPHYVFPLSMLVAALRREPELPNRYDAEFTALCDLWDIDQDDSELSLDPDQDTVSMDTT